MTNKVVIGTEELLAKLRSMREEVQSNALGAAAKSGATVIKDAASSNIKEQGLWKTRDLARSIHIQVEADEKQAVAEIGTNLEYAAIHEYGGTIKPKTAKYLAIPVGTYKGSPTRYSDLKVRKTPSGTLILVDARGGIQYVLKNSVEIPARPYLRPAFDEHQAEAQEEMAKTFVDAILKASK